MSRLIMSVVNLAMSSEQKQASGSGSNSNSNSDSNSIVSKIYRSLPWSQRLSFIFYWQILRRESLLKFFLLARSADSREKKASGRDRWEPHFHSISF